MTHVISQTLIILITYLQLLGHMLHVWQYTVNWPTLHQSQSTNTSLTRVQRELTYITPCAEQTVTHHW